MMKVITISREYGAGGHSIGCQVAERLGIPFYDKDIVSETVKASGYEPELIEDEQEEAKRSTEIWKRICAMSNSFYPDTQDAIHDVQKVIIQRLASEGPCVILGRCADEILREAGIESLNVFIHADDVHRAVRVSELIGSKDATKIQKLMAKKDDGRHTYYHHYTGKRWGDGHNYHMTLDSGILGYETCINLIVEAAKACQNEE